MDADTALGEYSYGYSSSRVTPFRTSEIDFRDVFGGPPRRLSIHEMMRYSFTEGADSFSGRRRLSETPSFRDPWTVAEDKPVFGAGMEGGTRRRGLEDDFFVDIFKGCESPSSTTPRKLDRPDLFSDSPPGSRPLSPGWPPPPGVVEGFVGPSSAPTNFSLPSKLSKLEESPTLGSSNRTSSRDVVSKGTSNLHSPKVSVFGLSSRPVQVQDVCRNNGTHYRPSPLSQQSSLPRENSDDLEKDTGNSEDVTSSHQFHFSIYKWAGKGVPLIMPLGRARSWRLPGKGKTESFDGRAEASDEVVNRSASDLSLKVELEACQLPENEVLTLQNEEAKGNNVEGISVRTMQKEKNGKSSRPNIMNPRESSENEMKGGVQKLSRHGSKSMKVFLHDKDEEQGNNEDIIDQKSDRTSGTERSRKGSSRTDNNSRVLKKLDDELLARRSEEAKKVSTRGSPRNSEDGIGKKRSKGKVKEFIKIFSQDASPAKPKTSIHPQNESFTEKERGTPEATLEANNRKSTMVNGRMNVSLLAKPSHDYKKVADPCKESCEELPKRDSTHILFSDASSGQKDNSTSRTATATEDARITDEDTDDSCIAFFTIKELREDDYKQGQPTGNCEEIQAIDTKVRQWSYGKEGNIRSLLSTLQYVLWPGSGWKPVPLVDIIEGSAVKRAYQRALLCLHPDKLQQKGADPSQKYMAEKVFDILQESWTHFSTAGAV
ncbi:hypothetical protein SAY86_003939 [Trapa natans]|uniref:J domain-containing protein required for chloroplast accumulation response 1 n=1 Tax=Trapa natans TaxID=22666 RepID=A0AAN7RHH8_TRANT|nr:hypothetical protein SAY86_003939 [Trapa natans]